MACSKHPIRKRKDCPECTERAILNKPIIAGLSKTIEPIAEDMKWKETPVVPVATPEVIIKKKRKALEDINEVPVVFNCLEEHKEDVDNYFELKLAEFKARLKSIALVRYENLYVPKDIFTVDLMVKLSSQGWKLVNFWDANISKLSSVKGPCAVLERIVSENNKPIPEYKF